MGSKQKTQTNQQTSGTTVNSYGWQQNPGSADINALRTAVAPVQEDPSIPFAFANERERMNNSFKNPLGAYTSPAVRDAANRSAGGQLNMAERVASEGSRAAAQERSFAQQATVAGMTAPQLTQTGGSSTGSMSGTQVQSYNPGIGSYISQAAGMGVGLL